MSKVINITEEDLVYAVKSTIHKLLKEEVETSEDFWQTIDGKSAGYEKKTVETEDMPNDDFDADSSDNVSDGGSSDNKGGSGKTTGTATGSISSWDSTKPDETKDGTKDDYKPTDSVEVKGDDASEPDKNSENSSDGSQNGQGGDPFSQKPGDSDSTNDNGGTTSSENDGWGDAVNNVIDNVVDAFIKEQKRLCKSN